MQKLQIKIFYDPEREMTEICKSCFHSLGIRPGLNGQVVTFGIDMDIPEIMLTEKPCVSFDVTGFNKVKSEGLQLRQEGGTVYLEAQPSNLVANGYKTATIVLSIVSFLLLLVAIGIWVKK